MDLEDVEVDLLVELLVVVQLEEYAAYFAVVLAFITSSSSQRKENNNNRNKLPKNMWILMSQLLLYNNLSNNLWE